MGCFGSRFDKRASGACENLYSVALQFTGGEEGVEQDTISNDLFVKNQGKEGAWVDLKNLYPTEGGKAKVAEDADKKLAEGAVESAWKFVAARHAELSAADQKDGKDARIGDKYSRKAVIAQLQNVIDSFKAAGHPEPKAADATTPPPATAENTAGDDQKGDNNDVQNDGGMNEDGKENTEEVKDMGGMQAATNPAASSTDEDKYEGAENIPGLFLRNALINEYFGDLVKQEIISVQFRGKSIHAELQPAAGYLTSGLRTSEMEDKEAWFSGYFGELDDEAVRGLQDKAPISFPGWIAGWASEDDAKNYLKFNRSDQPDNQKHKQVIIKVTNAPTVTALGNRLVCHRLHGTVAGAPTEADGVVTLNITADKYDATDLADSLKPAPAAPTTQPEDTTKEAGAAGGENNDQPGE